MFERQLRERDETISQLRKAMEAEDERVALLELQLGQLIELSSKQCALQQPPSSFASTQETSIANHEANHNDDKMEIAALQPARAFGIRDAQVAATKGCAELNFAARETAA